jgi:hypothetical protein
LIAEYRLAARDAQEVEHARDVPDALKCDWIPNHATSGGYAVNINLTLVTKRNPSKIKGFDSTFGAILDPDNNLVCLVPLIHMDWVYDCLCAKTTAKRLDTRLSKATDAVPEPSASELHESDAGKVNPDVVRLRKRKKTRVRSVS